MHPTAWLPAVVRPLVRPLVGRLARGLLVLLVMAGVPLMAANASAVAEVAFDGLPAEITAEIVTMALTLKPGTPYDKAVLPADRDRVTALLKDQGFLDADAKTVVNFIPAGVRLTFAIKARNRYTIEAVTAEGVPEATVAALLAEAKIGKDTPCTQAVVDQLALALAPKIGINVLYLDAERKPNANKKEATLVFRR